MNTEPTDRTAADVHQSEQGITWVRIQGSTWVRAQSAYGLLHRLAEVSRALVTA